MLAEEEQKLKELQLDYSEKVAVVEALKMELRQTRHGAQAIIWHTLQVCNLQQGHLSLGTLVQGIELSLPMAQ